MMINVLFFTFIEKYVVAMRCYGYCSQFTLPSLPSSDDCDELPCVDENTCSMREEPIFLCECNEGLQFTNDGRCVGEYFDPLPFQTGEAYKILFSLPQKQLI